MSTVVHMTRIIVREQCPFAAYSTYLESKQTPNPSIAFSCSVATPFALYCP